VSYMNTLLNHKLTREECMTHLQESVHNREIQCAIT